MKIEERMNYYYDVFTENDKYICKTILKHERDCISLSIEEFARKYHISTSALSRFAQKLQLPGYSELKAALRLKDHPTFSLNLQINHMMDCYHQCIQDIEKKDCKVLFENMKQASTMIIFGDGYTQGRVAKEMKRIFLPTGKKIYDVYGYDIVEPLVKSVDEKDMIFLISLNGEGKELLSFAEKLKIRGVFTTSITRMKSNSLAHLCDENLYIHSTQFSINENMTYEVTTTYFILLELLYVKYKLYLEE